jgi:hypothetical protein
MNRLYSRNRIKFLNTQFDWANRQMIMTCCRGPYTFDEEHITSDELVANGAELVASSLPMTGQTAMPGGYAMSDLIVVPAVPANTLPVTFLVLFDVTEAGTVGNVPLVYIDEAMGLPFVPNGLDQQIQPDWLNHRGWFRA